MVSNIPLSWLWLFLGGNPYTVVFVSIITSIIAVFTRLWLLREQVYFSIRSFSMKVIFPLVATFIVAALVGFITYPLFPHNFIGLVSYGLLTVITTGLIASILGLTKEERAFVIGLIRSKLPNFF